MFQQLSNDLKIWTYFPPLLDEPSISLNNSLTPGSHIKAGPSDHGRVHHLQPDPVLQLSHGPGSVFENHIFQDPQDSEV